MKKRILVVLLVILAISALMLVSCKQHEHNYSELKEVKVEATCTAAGTSVYACECGETTEKEVPAVAHAYEATTVAPTCKNNGYTVNVCTACGAETEKSNIIAAGDQYHSFDKMVQEAADCKTGKKGRDARVCSICDKEDPSYPNKITNPQHTWDEENPVIVAPTCEEAGSSTIVCANCGQQRGSTPIPATGHEWETVDGTEVAANCYHGTQRTVQCAVCEVTVEQEDNDQLAHDIQEGLKPATCTTSAIIYEYCAREGCEYTKDKAADGDPNGHDTYQAELEIVPSTCTTPGTMTPYCKTCGELVVEETETLALTNHYVTSENEASYDVIETVQASCHTAYYEVRQCTADANCTQAAEKFYCGAAKMEHDLVPITDLYPEAQLSYAATCVSIGYDVYVCKNCTDKGNEHQCEGDGTTPCYEHRKTSDKVDHEKTTVLTATYVDSTCITPASVKFTCQHCNGTYDYTYPTTDTGAAQVGNYSFVALKEHGGWIETSVKESSTCTTEGYTVYICTKDESCVQEMHGDIQRYSEHTFVRNATEGVYKCSVCNTTYRDITTVLDEPLKTGSVELIDGVSFSYEVIGYENAAENAEAFTSANAYVFTPEEKTPSLAGGLIVIKTDATVVEYTITITDGEGTEAVYSVRAVYDSEQYNVTVTSADGETAYSSLIPSEKVVYFDLYEQDDVASIKIETTEDATVRLFTNEG